MRGPWETHGVEGGRESLAPEKKWQGRPPPGASIGRFDLPHLHKKHNCTLYNRRQIRRATQAYCGVSWNETAQSPLSCYRCPFLSTPSKPSVRLCYVGSAWLIRPVLVQVPVLQGNGEF